MYSTHFPSTNYLALTLSKALITTVLLYQNSLDKGLSIDIFSVRNFALFIDDISFHLYTATSDLNYWSFSSLNKNYLDRLEFSILSLSVTVKLSILFNAKCLIISHPKAPAPTINVFYLLNISENSLLFYNLIALNNYYTLFCDLKDLLVKSILFPKSTNSIQSNKAN